MPRRLWLSLAMLAVGGGLLVTSALAGPSLRQGGVFRVGITGASVQTDPHVSYISTALWLEYATAVKLDNGVTAKGNRLIIRLTRADASFLTKLTMPFFQATSTKVPLTHEVTGAYPSAGPYRFTRNEVNALTEIRRNPYYRGRRPHHL